MTGQLKRLEERMDRLTRFLSKSISVIFAFTTSSIFKTSCGFSILWFAI